VNNRLTKEKGAVNRGALEIILKKRRKWKYFIEENINLDQFNIDRPKQRTPECILEKKGPHLGAYWT